MVLDFNVNYLSVIVAAIVSFVIGWIWYGPLFGKQWRAYMNISKKDMAKSKDKNMAKAQQQAMTKSIIGGFITQLIMAYILAALFVSLGILTVGTGLTLAFFIWLGFVATIGLGIVLWEQKPFGLYLINSLLWLVGLLAMAIVLTVWP